VAVIVKRRRPGLFCITFHLEVPNKKYEETLFRYSTEFKIENQMCELDISFIFTNTIPYNIYKGDVDFCWASDGDKGGEDDESKPIKVSIVMNEEEEGLMLEKYDRNHWGSYEYIACPAKKCFTDITSWETSNPNEWNPLTCHLLLEFETAVKRKNNALKQITELYVQQIHCDVQFNFEDDQHIGGHSLILVSRSPVFAAMFQHEMKEKKTGQISIPDIHPDIFKQLLHYIYSVQLSVPLTEITAQQLFEAADKYDINDLKDECIDFLLDCVRVDNMINLMAWAHIHSVDELTEETLKLIKFTSLHGKEISQLKDWENLKKNYPEVCLEATRRIIDQMSPSFKR
jgi:hypothetical protein